MKRCLAVVVFLAIILPIYGCKESPKADGNKGDPRNPGQTAAAPVGTASCVVKEEGTTIECKWPEGVPESYFKRLFSPENAPNISLFVVGFAGIIAAIVTLRKLERQTAATEKQANHMIASERAWIMAELSLSSNGLPLTQWNDHAAGGVPKTNIYVNLRCINDGDSPAWITEKSARLFIGSGDELPVTPKLAKEDILEEGFDPLGPGKDAVYEGNITGTGRHSTQTATIIYGVVKYRDIFGENRETGFCYQFSGYQGNRKLVRIFCGPEYSKQT